MRAGNEKTHDSQMHMYDEQNIQKTSTTTSQLVCKCMCMCETETHILRKHSNNRQILGRDGERVTDVQETQANIDEEKRITRDNGERRKSVFGYCSTFAMGCFHSLSLFLFDTS